MPIWRHTSSLTSTTTVSTSGATAPATATGTATAAGDGGADGGAAGDSTWASRNGDGFEETALPSSSPPSSALVMGDLFDSLEVEASSQCVIDSGNAKRSMSRRISTIMSQAHADCTIIERGGGSGHHSNSKTRETQTAKNKKNGALALGNLAISLQFVAVDSVRSGRDVSDNNMELVALALAMRTKMVPRLFLLVLQMFPVESEDSEGFPGLINPGNASRGSILRGGLGDNQDNNTSTESHSDDEENGFVPRSAQRQPFAASASQGLGQGDGEEAEGVARVSLSSPEHLNSAFHLLGGSVGGSHSHSHSGSSPIRQQRPSAGRCWGLREIVAMLQLFY